VLIAKSAALYQSLFALVEFHGSEQRSARLSIKNKMFGTNVARVRVP
jgi:hypothetical protein